MTSPASRRGFLRGLTTLPLIGGGVTFIGQPTAVAEPISRELLESYSAWLYYERQYLQAATFPAGTTKGYSDIVPGHCAGANFHQGDPGAFAPAGDGWRHIGLAAQRRAALVLSAIGCDWREAGR